MCDVARASDHRIDMIEESRKFEGRERRHKWAVRMAMRDLLDHTGSTEDAKMIIEIYWKAPKVHGPSALS